MDTLQLLREKRDELRSLRPTDGVDAALRHIEVAERHFGRGRAEGDSDLFTDVVFRTNHAFEGLLKEAYAVLSGLEASHKTPHQIEQYFATKKILHERVLEQFTHYRTKWRNPSTHDHRIDYGEAESLLAISSVSAFFFAALDQMIRRAATTKAVEESKLSKAAGKFASVDEFCRHIATDYPDVLSQLMSSQDAGRAGHVVHEMTLLGLLEGMLRKEGASSVQIEPLLKAGKAQLRPDVLLTIGDAVAVVEFRLLPSESLGRLSSIRRHSMYEKLFSYMAAAGATASVGLLLSPGPLPPGWRYEVIEENSLVGMSYIAYPRESTSPVAPPAPHP